MRSPLICTKGFLKCEMRKSNNRNKVDEGTYIRKGPGRKRQNPPKDSSQLRCLAKSFLRKKILQILGNKKCINRKDACITFFIRALKKTAYYLVEQAAAKNMYKRKVISDYLVSFAESFVAFMSCIKSSETPLCQSFLEYIIIYFPSDKCQRILKI